MTTPPDPEPTAADFAHALARMHDAPTLAHALAARLALDGNAPAGAALNAYLTSAGIVSADTLPGGPPDPHQT